MNTVPLLVSVLELIVGLALILAIFRIFSIDSNIKKIRKSSESSEYLLRKILKAIETADGNRREEFESMTAGEASEEA